MRGREHDHILRRQRRARAPRHHHGREGQLRPVLYSHLQPPRPDRLERQLHGPADDQDSAAAVRPINVFRAWAHLSRDT